MAGFYDPYGRRQNAPRRSPTIDDFNALVKEYQKLQQQAGKTQEQAAALQSQVERQAAELKETRQELEIKTEALHKQAEALKETESELVWAKAALKQQNAQEEAHEEQTAAEEASWKERYARLQADLENMRKRWEQRFQNEVSSARHQILQDMLPLADHLDLALQHVDGLDEKAAKDFVANIQATRQAFLDTLSRYGIRRIDPLHAEFDPERHEAIGHIPSDDVPADHVAVVTQAGYAEDGKLLRPARVLVSSGPVAAGVGGAQTTR